MVGGRDWSHGVEVRRRVTNGTGNRRASQVLIRRIYECYEDGGRTCFVPEAGEEFFSQDLQSVLVGQVERLGVHGDVYP